MRIIRQCSHEIYGLITVVGKIGQLIILYSNSHYDRDNNMKSKKDAGDNVAACVYVFPRPRAPPLLWFTPKQRRFLHMHNKYSDYVANKTDAEAIVCRSVTGEDVRLTRADFESDEEFQRWKGWSDADYKQSERRDRAYNDRRLSLAAAYFLSDRENECLSGEPNAAEQKTRDDLVSHIRSLLTDTSFIYLYISLKNAVFTRFSRFGVLVATPFLRHLRIDLY